MAVRTSRSSWPINRFRMRPMRANHVRFARFNLLASAVHGLLRFLSNSQCVRLGDINAPRHSRVHRQRRRTTRSLVVFLPHRAMAELHTNRNVFHGEQREQNRHNDEVADYGTWQPREIDEQDGHENREAERDEIELRNVALTAQHGNDLIQEVDRRSHAASSDHDIGQSSIGLEIQTVNPAHKRYADPAHKNSRHARECEHNAHHGQECQIEALAAARVGPFLRKTHEQRLIHKLNRKHNALRWEIQCVEVQLAIVREHAFHHELRHALDEVEQEHRQEQREALLENHHNALKDAAG